MLDGRERVVGGDGRRSRPGQSARRDRAGPPHHDLRFRSALPRRVSAGDAGGRRDRPRVHGRDRRHRPGGDHRAGRRPGGRAVVHRMREVPVLRRRPARGVRHHQPERRDAATGAGLSHRRNLRLHPPVRRVPGSHAEYIRVPFGDVNCFQIPEVSATNRPCSCRTRYRRVTWAPTSATSPRATPWRSGARRRRSHGRGECEDHGRRQGDRDRPFPRPPRPRREEGGRRNRGLHRGRQRLRDAPRKHRRTRTGRCIDAVGMEGHGTGVMQAYDKVKQALRMESDRATSLREAILSCGKAESCRCSASTGSPTSSRWRC